MENSCIVHVTIVFKSFVFPCHRDFRLMLDSGCRHQLSARTPIEIYDLAGHPEYYTSHSAIMKSLCLESSAVFVLMVDLTKAEKQLSKEIYK